MSKLDFGELQRNELKNKAFGNFGLTSKDDLDFGQMNDDNADFGQNPNALVYPTNEGGFNGFMETLKTKYANNKKLYAFGGISVLALISFVAFKKIKSKRKSSRAF